MRKKKNDKMQLKYNQANDISINILISQRSMQFNDDIFLLSINICPLKVISKIVPSSLVGNSSYTITLQDIIR